MQNKIIILAGMPGAGKGAVSKIMKWLPNTKHLSAGELLRAVDRGTELGQKVDALQKEGKIVDAEIVNALMKQALVSGSDFIFDGFPRSVEQAEWLFENAKDFEIFAVLLEIDEGMAEKRRDHRIKHMLDNGETPRKDDLDPNALPKRFAEYREKTAPTIDYLREKLGDNFCAIDGAGYLEDVYDNIMCKIIRN